MADKLVATVKIGVVIVVSAYGAAVSCESIDDMPGIAAQFMAQARGLA